MKCRRFLTIIAVVSTMTFTAWQGVQAENGGPALQKDEELETDSDGTGGGDDAAAVAGEEDFFAMAGTGRGAAAQTFAPNMIGDLLGGPCIPIYFDEYYSESCISSPSGGPIVGRVKLSDNNSPLPRDRVFLDYSYFHNVPLTSDGMGVNRFTPGIEKTFLDGMASIEVRLPLFSTLNSNVFLDLDDGSHTGDIYGGELGNLAVFLKSLLWQCDTTAIAAGLGVITPTADDMVIYDAFDNSEVASIKNDSVHFIPYVAMLYTPTERHFVQAFIQMDIDGNGNRVFVNDAEGAVSAGRWTDQTLLYVDVSAGTWLYRNPCAGRGLTGLAGLLEVHYNQSVNDIDSIDFNDGEVQIGGAVGDVDDNLSIVNLTIGATAVFGEATTVTAGYGMPISSDRVFDGELRVMLNRYF